jgi:hypothetical protein
MPCAEVSVALSTFSACEETPEGARVPTHCLYPSFETVFVYVARVGDGFHVHDGRGAYESARLHGRDASVSANAVAHEAKHFHLQYADDHAIIANVVSAEWLESAILSVANASALAARRALEINEGSLSAGNRRNLTGDAGNVLDNRFLGFVGHDGLPWLWEESRSCWLPATKDRLKSQ